jgi:hypothetical protein
MPPGGRSVTSRRQRCRSEDLDYQPQLESWNGNLLHAHTAVMIKTPETTRPAAV